MVSSLKVSSWSVGSRLVHAPGSRLVHGLLAVG